jgi:hypothetical protein
VTWTFIRRVVFAIDRSRDAHGAIFRHTIIEEIVMKLDSKSGATLAAAAATLFLAGAVATMTTSVARAAGEGHCLGANACKGQSACKGLKSPGPGQNACKGQGFAQMSKAECAAAHGKFKEG